jgi:hypothetical protein
MSGLFPVLTYKSTFQEVEVACLPVPGKEVFRRVGKTNSFRQVAVFEIGGKKYVAKTYARPLGEIVWRDTVISKQSYDEAARYLPVAHTVFILGREVDREFERYIIRLQEYCPRRLCDLSDAELRAPAMKAQLLDILDAVERTLNEVGWLPDMFGHPAKPEDIPHWPSLRRSTNIMVSEDNRVLFVDINYPRPWNATSNPVGQAALWGAKLRFEEFRRFLNDDSLTL